MAKLSYQRTIIGYHGCDAKIADRVLAGTVQMKPSANAYDWLGEGIYFWEHGPRRAYEWAIDQARLSGRKIQQPAVLGAKINLGVCLDLLDTANTRLLGKGFVEFRQLMQRNGIAMPKNRNAAGSRRGDRVLRFLDCAVIDFTVKDFAATEPRYQTVRGVFVEGRPAFPGSKVALKSHIQIAVRDPACILDVFRPAAAEYQALE
ncbi:MAG: hypothetical protein C5B50_18365 [Verrucomicrobia bacterium]|nr:MAG: hypothetical protein C5B50_18365 [Verrucomicrobiota bacterium]